ncbi:hypothetical protein [Thalassolituus marinus]|uniref:Uncharacterized protein n=1 Tax=Thalassolituus marinus TaxID=671053 RepID=A0ABS7ZR27_9GAMM|nr:hypothetical protein [Thalassolituus marinus]MCA6064174.1 hypothetical protein [Thalassolituus marinus]
MANPSQKNDLLKKSPARRWRNRPEECDICRVTGGWWRAQVNSGDMLNGWYN